MHRLFVALRPPHAIRERLARTMEGVPGARWQDDDQLHLTLRFVGEVERPQAEEIAPALSGLRTAAVTARLADVGSFGDARAVTSLWAGIAPHAPLTALHAKVDRACTTAGISPDRRAYRPHITLARLSRTAGAKPAVAEWLVRHAGLSSTDFALDRLILYESLLRHDGAVYEAVAEWPLVGER